MSTDKSPPLRIGRDTALKQLKELMREKPSGSGLTDFARDAMLRTKDESRDYRGEALTAVAMLEKRFEVH